MPSTIKTCQSDDFLPLADLVAKKTRQAKTISLVIPALNEAKTVGAIVEKAHRGLMERYALLDEIIVMDGGSTDATAAVAAKAGARVFHTAEVGPRAEFPAGKGTSLWRSLFVAKGDILIFVDADIVNFDNRFVYGLAGALLDNPALRFVKAYYRRPLIAGKIKIDNQGGRVTELTARPLLSLWYPELARIWQPLSGEFAAPREVLRQVAFSSGYGVEIRMLLSIYRKFGLSKIAQVNMGTRIHRNRPLAELGRMSAALLLEFFKFLHEERKINLVSEPETIMQSPGAEGWQEAAIDEARLPPADDIEKGAQWL
jgi:glucosyl-3-phosphoglycerate synthase